MKLTVIEIAKFCEKELSSTFNQKFDIYEDNLINKVKEIIMYEFAIDYTFDKFVCDILENIKELNLQDMEKDEEGNIIQDLDAKEIQRIKKLISLYFIVSYNAIGNMVDQAVLRIKLKKIIEDLDNNKI